MFILIIEDCYLCPLYILAILQVTSNVRRACLLSPVIIVFSATSRTSIIILFFVTVCQLTASYQFNKTNSNTVIISISGRQLFIPRVSDHIAAVVFTLAMNSMKPATCNLHFGDLLFRYEIFVLCWR